MLIAGNIGAFKAGLAGGWYVRTPERGKRDITQIMAASGKGWTSGFSDCFFSSPWEETTKLVA